MPVCLLVSLPPALIEYLSNPDNLFVIFFLGLMLFVVALLLWTDKKLKAGKNADR